MWSDFYVQWGLGVIIVIGGLGGAFFAPRERKLAELAERDIAAAEPRGERRRSAPSTKRCASRS